MRGLADFGEAVAGGCAEEAAWAWARDLCGGTLAPWKTKFTIGWTFLCGKCSAGLYRWGTASTSHSGISP